MGKLWFLMFMTFIDDRYSNSNPKINSFKYKFKLSSMLHPTDNNIHLNSVGGGELIRNLQNDKDRERGRRAHPPVISSNLGWVPK